MLPLTLNFLTENLPIIIYVIVVTIVNYFISKKLVERNPKYVFIIPGVFFSVSAVFGLLALTTDGWDALGYILIAMFSLFCFLGSIASSLYIFFKSKRKD